MSTLGGYATQKAYNPVPRPRGPRAKLREPMKPTLKQRIYNWLSGANDTGLYASDRAVEADSLNSNGMRFNLYKANGGFVIETRIYDERNDRNINKLHVITEDQDLGAAIGKIITMESLR